MNIAIVDDEKVELETAEIFLRCYVQKFLKDYEASIHIETFRAPDEFFCPNFYQVVILGGKMKSFAKSIAARANNDAKIFLLEDDCEGLS